MKHNLLPLLFLFLSLAGSAQDIHSSHIHATPTFLNPALTGLLNEDLRFMASTRSQWKSVTQGYTTHMGSVDSKLYSFSGGDMIGGGLNVFSDKAGDVDFKTTGVGIGLSYLKALKGYRGGSYVSFGVQASQLSHGFDHTKVVAFDDEPLVVNGGLDQVNFLDVSAGVAWFYEVNRTTNFHIGVSAWHLNQPEVSFFESNELSTGQLLYRKLVFHGAADIKLSRKANLKPSFIFVDQGPNREITMGTFYKYRTKLERVFSESSSIYIGGWLRWYAEKDVRGVDAIVAAVRFDYKNTYLTFTFDVNISSLKNVSRGAGGPEFSIVQLLEFDQKRKPFKVRCPGFSY